MEFRVDYVQSNKIVLLVDGILFHIKREWKDNKKSLIINICESDDIMSIKFDEFKSNNVSKCIIAEEK